MGKEYPFVSFHFRAAFNFGGKSVEIPFQEISGLTKEVQTEELVEGGENRFVHRFPKEIKHGNLTLKRGVVIHGQLMDWAADAVEQFIYKPIDVDIVLLNEKSHPLLKWNFTRCWPVKYSSSDLKAQDNVILLETLELCYQNFSLKSI